MHKRAPGRYVTPGAVRAAAIVSLLSPTIIAVAVVAQYGPTVATSIVAAACVCGAAAAGNWWSGWAYRAGLREARELAAAESPVAQALLDRAELALLDRHLDEVDPFSEA